MANRWVVQNLTTIDKVTELYVATLGRAPDKGGLAYWVNQVTTGALTIAQVANSFFAQPETQALYPSGTTNGSFVIAVYNNALGRAPDTAGLAYWTAELDAGRTTRADFILAFLQGAYDDPAATPPSFDASLLTNQHIAAEYFAGVNSAGATVNPDAKDFPWAGTPAEQANFLLNAAAVMTPVTADASTIALSKALSDAFETGGGVVGSGQTFTLTTNVDTIPGLLGSLGTTVNAGDDIIIAGEGSVGGQHTLGSSDVINGGTGTDRINIRLADVAPVALAGQAITPNMTSVEKVYTQAINSAAGGSNLINAVNVKGTTEWWSDNSTASLNLTNVQEKAAIGVRLGLATSNYSVQMSKAAVTGALDVVVDTALVNNLFVDDLGTGAAAATGFATINLNASVGASTITTLGSGGDIKTLNVSGAGSVKITTALDAGLTTLNAATNSGGTNFNVSASAQGVAYTGGTGNDRIDFGANIDVSDKIDGGTGRNTLAVTSQAQIVTGLQVTNEQVLELNTLNGTLETTRIAGIDEVQVVKNGATNATLNSGIVNGLASGNTFTTNATLGDLKATVNVTNANVAGTLDTLNINVGSAQTYLFSAPGVETINLNNTTTALDTTVNFFDLDGAVDLRTLNVTSKAGSITLLNELNNTIKTVNAAGAAGAVNVSVAAGNLTSGVEITSGAGNDVLRGGDGADSVTTGAGSDRIVLSTNANAANTAGRVDTINDFTLGLNNDVLDLAQLAAPVLDGAVSKTLVGSLTAQLPTAVGDGRAELIILDSTVAGLTAANAEALNALLFNLAGTGTYGNVLVAYSATVGGPVRLASATIVAGDVNNVIDVAVLANQTTASLNNGFNATNLTGFAGTGATLIATAVAFDTTTGVNITGSTKATDQGDVVQTLANFLAGSKIDGLAGVNALQITGGTGSLATVTALNNIATITLTAATTLTYDNVVGRTVTGSAAADTIILGAAAQSYTTGGGNDTVTTGAASQTVNAGAGTDTLVVANQAHVSGLSYTGAVAGDVLTLGFAGAANLSTATTLGGATVLNLDAASSQVTGSIAQHNQFTTVNGASTADVWTFTDAGVATGKATIETYNLANGVNTFTTAGAAQTVNGGTGNDTITLTGAFNQNIQAGGGDDSVVGGTVVNVNDTLNGGIGNDTLSFTDAGGTNDLDNVQGFETITLGNAITSVTTVDALVAAGTTLIVNGSAIIAANTLTWNGAAETNGAFSITGGTGGDTLTGGAGNDTFDLSLGGTEVVVGGAGNNTFNWGDKLGATDKLTSTGADIVNYSSGAANNLDLVTFAANSTVNIQNTTANALLTTKDGLVAAGVTLTVNANNLSTGTLNFVGTAEADGKFNITGGGANDTITGGTKADTINGGAGNDIITGGTGADALTGGAGIDQFRFATNLDGNALNTFALATADTIVDFAKGSDTLAFKFDAGNAGAVSMNSVVSRASGAAVGGAASDGVVFVNNATVTDFTSSVQAIAAIGATLTVNALAGQDMVFVVNNVAGTQAGIYGFQSAAADNTVTAAELTLIGVVNITGGALAVTDLNTF